MSRTRGFTLLEILVALTLFAVVGGTLLQLFGSGLRTARLATERTHAVLLARSKLTELVADRHLQPGTIGGDLPGGYRWQATFSPLDELDPDRRSSFEPLGLELSVTWGDPRDERQFVLRSMLLTQVKLR